MKSFLKPILFFILALATIVIFVSSTSPTPGSRLSELLAKTNLYNQRFPHERIYLHHDRPSYWTKDTIWFKAYLQSSPITDCNLNVELVSASGTVICSGGGSVVVLPLFTVFKFPNQHISFKFKQKEHPQFLLNFTFLTKLD